MDILKHIIPLICLLTIHDKETSFIEMFHFIENNKYVYNILMDQTKSWWGKSIDSNMLKIFIQVYIKYMKDDKETNQIIRTVKELFMKNITNSKQLSQLIDKYLIPQELEKKSNAEVSTLYKLRQEMLDKIPKDFWITPKKVFEPCSGKGGFLIDIIDRFMDGLKDVIPDDKFRYKTIVEECLYFSDINPTNIFVCKLLIDPYNEYKLNYNEGNTLELNIKEKWDLDGFDAVIGNPPYNSSGNTGTGNTIWQEFTKKSLNEWLTKNGYLLFVHPSGWRKPNTKRGKFYGLYKEMSQNNQMIFLSIHGIKDGQKVFNCGTRYDWYLIEKKINTKIQLS
jgi:type I restriction-modification system DNA methylase subunit